MRLERDQTRYSNIPEAFLSRGARRLDAQTWVAIGASISPAVVVGVWKLFTNRRVNKARK